jgi:Sulfotransferase family
VGQEREESTVHTETPVKVLEITGLDRSGSTILDIVLGNHPHIESVGEVANITVNGWISRESLRGIDPKQRRVPICTCGKRLDVLYVDTPDEACPYWSRVRREWVERTDPDSIENYPKLRDNFERTRSTTLVQQYVRLLYEKRRQSTSFRSYAGLTRAFFESIRAVSGKPIIVDSSTVPVQALALAMTPGIDLYAVHLVRDARGVVASHMGSFREGRRAGVRQDHKDSPMWKTVVRRRVLYLVSVVRWIIRNLASEWVCAQLGPKRTMRLRYEDFVADPKGALGRIGSLIDLDLTDVAEAASAGKPMQAGHNIGGNKTKKSGVITLRADDEEWKSALSPTEKRLSWMLMGWLMRRYGYKKQ